eukprot:scaffold445539_cov31-Prasinocladus_malaysianus.AAC.1
MTSAWLCMYRSAVPPPAEGHVEELTERLQHMEAALQDSIAVQEHQAQLIASAEETITELSKEKASTHLITARPHARHYRGIEYCYYWTVVMQPQHYDVSLPAAKYIIPFRSVYGQKITRLAQTRRLRIVYEYFVKLN